MNYKFVTIFILLTISFLYIDAQEYKYTDTIYHGNNNKYDFFVYKNNDTIIQDTYFKKKNFIFKREVRVKDEKTKNEFYPNNNISINNCFVRFYHNFKDPDTITIKLISKNENEYLKINSNLKQVIVSNISNKKIDSLLISKNDTSYLKLTFYPINRNKRALEGSINLIDNEGFDYKLYFYTYGINDIRVDNIDSLETITLFKRKYEKSILYLGMLDDMVNDYYLYRYKDESKKVYKHIHNTDTFFDGDMDLTDLKEGVYYLKVRSSGSINKWIKINLLPYEN